MSCEQIFKWLPRFERAFRSASTLDAMPKTLNLPLWKTIYARKTPVWRTKHGNLLSFARTAKEQDAKALSRRIARRRPLVKVYSEHKRVHEQQTHLAMDRAALQLERLEARKLFAPPMLRPTAHIAGKHLLGRPRPSIARAPILSRGFSTSRPTRGLPLIFGLNALKATTLLRTTTTATRILLSLFPLTLRARLMHLKHATRPHLFNSRAFIYSLLALPFAMLAAVLALHSERTPLTGRWRFQLLDADERRQLLLSMVEGTSVRRLAVADEVHWYHILRKVSFAPGPERLLAGCADSGRAGCKARTAGRSSGLARRLAGRLAAADVVQARSQSPRARRGAYVSS
jgi:hypothetical protein